MVNCLMFASETPNKCKAFGFAATNWRSAFVTTIASRELAINSRKSFSLARRASCSLRVFSRTFFPRAVSVLSPRRRCAVTCSQAAKSCDLNLVILSLVTTIASRELAITFRKSLARHASCSLRVFSRTSSPISVSVFSTRRRYAVTCSQAAKSCDLNLAILSLVTTIASRELASTFRKSLARYASSSLRVFPRTLFPHIVSAFSTRRRCAVTCSQAAKSCDLNLAILSLVTAIASRELASTFRKSLARYASSSLRVFSRTFFPLCGERAQYPPKICRHLFPSGKKL